MDGMRMVVCRDERGSVWSGFDRKPNRNHIYSVSKIKNQNQTKYNLCVSKFGGGLGVRSLRNFNTAMLAKQG